MSTIIISKIRCHFDSPADDCCQTEILSLLARNYQTFILIGWGREVSIKGFVVEVSQVQDEHSSLVSLTLINRLNPAN